MTFQSYDFAIFLLAVLLVYWQLPHRGQNLFLLAVSYFFYGYVHPWYCLLIAATTLIDFTAAHLLARRPPGSRGRKRILAASLTATFSILCWFKYFNFFTGAAWLALDRIGLSVPRPVIEILLPVGISFYTFQSASYVVDVFRGKRTPCDRLLDYALYVAFFPQLVAGPIERADHLLGQVLRARTAEAGHLRDGVVLVCWGFFQKLAIADTCGLLANRAFSIEGATFPVVWGGVIAFGVQIYADFSAYTDIARGVAKLLGFDLMKNFNHPYVATSPVDFWRRWHISLSTWFRDYVYIPLGGSRRGPGRVVFNLLVTFTLSGLWHGSNWNFLLWGAYHGVLVAAQHLLHRPAAGVAGPGGRRLFPRLFGWAFTFVAVHVGWLLFREQNTAYLIRYLTLSPFDAPVADWETGLYLAAHAQIMALPLWLFAIIDRHRPWLASKLGGPTPRSRHARRFALQCALALVLVFLATTLRSPVSGDFIYFQF